MNIHKSALRSASVLTAVTAVFWVASAFAAPLPPYPSNSGALFASVMQDQTPVEESDSDETLAPDLQRQMVSYSTAAAAGTIIIDTAQTYLYFVLGDGKAIRYGIGVVAMVLRGPARRR